MVTTGIDLTGKVFGRLTVVSLSDYKGNTSRPKRHWNCKCSCGNTKTILAFHLTDGTSKSCGCSAKELVKRPLNDITGSVVGDFVVTEYVSSSKWVVKCQCGKEYHRRADSILSLVCDCKKEAPRTKEVKPVKLPEDLTDLTFGRLKVLSAQDTRDAKGRARRGWLCSCSCGCTKVVGHQNLKSGSSTSCGCLAEEMKKQPRSEPSPHRSNNERFIRFSETVNGVGTYDYSRLSYETTEVKVEIGCNSCGNFWFTKPRVLTSGKGCPTCARSGYKTEKAGSLYILYCDDMLKIGITNRAVKKRAAQISKEYGKDFTILKEYKFSDGSVPLGVEKQLLKYLRGMFESPTQKFGGHTECFLGVEADWLIDIVESSLDKYDYKVEITD